MNFHVVNTADPEWVLTGTTATLTTPEGLPLAPTTTAPQTLTVNFGDIAGGKDASIDWIVRGDAAGDYTPSVELKSTLSPVGEPIDMIFKAATPIHVYGAGGVKMVFDVPPTAIAPFPIKCPIDTSNPDPSCYSIDKWLPGTSDPGELQGPAVPFVIRIGLTNTTPVPIYKASITLDDLSASIPGVAAGDTMFTAGIGVVAPPNTTQAIQRPLLMGFGEKLSYSWLQIDPGQTVWGTWILIPPFGAPIDVSQSSVQHSGGNSDFHAQVQIDPSLGQGITNADLDVVTRGLGQLTVTSDQGVHLAWTPVEGAKSYLIYRSQDRYSWTRAVNFIAEVDASTLSYWDTTTTGTPGEPEAYFYAIETVFGPNASVPDGESHVLHPMTPVVDTNGLFGDPLVLRASVTGTATVSITGPDGSTIPSSAAGAGYQVASLSGTALLDGHYTITVAPTVADYFDLTVSGSGEFSDPGHWGYAFTPHMASLVGFLNVGESRSYDVLYDHLRGIQRIWLVGSADPRVDSTALGTGSGVLSTDTLTGDAATTLTINGANFDPASSVVYLGGRQLVVSGGSSTQLVVQVPYGTPVGWQDVLVTNADGGASWFYGAVRGVEFADIAIDRPSRDIPRSFGSTASFDLVVRNPAATGLSVSLDNAPATTQSDLASLSLTGLSYGWHLATLQLLGADGQPLAGTVARQLQFEVLPLRVDAAGAPLPWPTRLAGGDGGLSVTASDGAITLDTGTLPIFTRIAITVDGKDGTIVSVPAAGSISLGFAAQLNAGAHVLTVQVVDGSDRPAGPSDTELIWTTVDRRVVMDEARFAVPGETLTIPFRVVRGNDMPEYRYPQPNTDYSLTSLPPDTVVPAVDGHAVGAVPYATDGSGSYSFTATAGDHSVVIRGASTVISVATDTDADGRYTDRFDADGDGDASQTPTTMPCRCGTVMNTYETDRHPTTLSLQGPGALTSGGYTMPPTSDPAGLVTYIATLVDENGTPQAGQTVYLFLTDPLSGIVGAWYSAISDGLGRATFSFHPAFVTTSDYVIQARYAGDWWFQASEAHTILSVHTGSQPNIHVLPPQTAGSPFATDFDERTPLNVTGSSWGADATIDVALSCLDCVGFAGQVFSTRLVPNDIGAFASFVHDVMAALGTRSAAGVWRATATGEQSGATYSLLFRIDASPLPCGTDVSTPDLISADDTGAFRTDNITKNNQPTFALTGTPLFLIQLLEGLGVIGSGYADLFGNALITVDAPFADGEHLISAQVVNGEGVAGTPSDALSVTIDTVAPGSPVLDLGTQDTGIYTTDRITKDNLLGFGGSTESDALVTYADAGAVITGFTPADGAGVWSFTVGPLADGSYSLSAVATDLAGNASDSSTLAFTIDTVPPPAPVLVLTPDQDTGWFNIDGVTSFSTLQFSGTTEASGYVTLNDAYDTSTQLIAAYPNGLWLAQLGPLADGVHVLTAYAEDVAGNFSTPSAELPLTIDTTPPGAPVFAIDPSQDSFDHTDGVTNVSNLDFGAGFSAEPGAELDLYIGSQAPDGSIPLAFYHWTTVAADGSWSMHVGPLSDGLYLFDARLMDAAGNVGDDWLTAAMIDTSPPPAPVLALTAAEDTGSSQTDGVTSIDSFQFGGVTEAFAQVFVTDAFGPQSDWTTVGLIADEAGNWSVSFDSLAAGTHEFDAYAYDQAGNSSFSSLLVTIDETAPSIVGARDVDPNANDWNKTPVTVTYTCSDNIGIPSCSDPQTFNDGAGQIASGTAVDLAGNTAAATVGDINVDTVAPTVAGSRDVAANTDGWANAPVTVSFSCAEDLSGLDGVCPASQTFGEGVGQSASATVTDRAGNSASATVGGIDVDLTLPTIEAVVPPASTTGWYVTPPTITFSCFDALSGVASCSGPVTLSVGAGQSVTGAVVDRAGNSASVTVSDLNVGTTPTITAVVPTPNAAGWFDHDVTVSFVCTGGLAGVSSCSAPVTLHEGVGQTVTGTVVDLAGNTATATTDPINIDETAPTLAAVVPPANAAGWFNHDVTVAFTCGDLLSGVGSCPDAVTLGEGAGQTVSRTISDLAGNSTTVTTDLINIDETGPSISVSGPSPNGNGWFGSAPTFTFVCTDALSGVASCTAPVTFGEGAALSATGTVSDKAGNSASYSLSGVNVDLTAPTLAAVVPPANAAGWFNHDVTVAFTCGDLLSGVGSCPDAVTLGEGAGQTVSRTISDLAGNSTTVTTDLINIDETGPSISVSGPSPNGNGWFGSAPTFTFVCTDALSGVASCTAPVTFGEGAALSATGTVSDKAGNSASYSLSGVNVDLTAPTLAAVVPPANAAGWYGTAPTIGFTCGDSLSGVASCSGSVTVGEGSGQSVTGVVTDLAGHSASTTVTGLNVDLTAPTIAAVVPPPNANGWYRSAPTITFTCADALSGVAACSSAVTLSEGVGQSVSGAVTDKAGHTTIVTTQQPISVDLTPPAISAVVPAPNANGWFNHDVVITFTCSDTLSGVTSCPAPLTVHEGAGQTVSQTISDLAGNTATFTSAPISIDETAPTVTTTLSVPPNVNGWNNTPVTIQLTCSDALSGVTPSVCAPVTLGEGARQTVTKTVTDLAGNSTTVTVGPLSIDLTAPRVTFGAPVPAPNATGWNNTSVTIPYTVSDSLSGVAGATLGQLVLTTEGASVTGAVTVTDLAGNNATSTSPAVRIDKTAPAGSITINGGATTTSTPTVTIALAFTDGLSGRAQVRFSTDGGATWGAWQAYASTATVTLPAGAGLKTVVAQVTDAAGNTGQSSATITLSTAVLTITVTGVTSGPCDVCSTFVVRYAATGAVALSATLDGKPFASGATIDTFYLPAGDHILVVTAVDAAGKRTTQTITLSVHATIEGLICAVQKAVKLGLIDENQQKPLLAKLDEAKEARDRGAVESETGQLNAFIHDLQAQRGKKIDPATDDRFVGWTVDLLNRIAASTPTCQEQEKHEHDGHRRLAGEGDPSSNRDGDHDEDCDRDKNSQHSDKSGSHHDLIAPFEPAPPTGNAPLFAGGSASQVAQPPRVLGPATNAPRVAPARTAPRLAPAPALGTAQAPAPLWLWALLLALLAAWIGDRFLRDRRARKVYAGAALRALSRRILTLQATILRILAKKPDARRMPLRRPLAVAALPSATARRLHRAVSTLSGRGVGFRSASPARPFGFAALFLAGLAVSFSLFSPHGGSSVLSLFRVAQTISAPSCTVNWTGGAGTDNWGDAGNWSTGAVPGTDAVVCIPQGNGRPVMYAQTTDPMIGSIRSDRPLTITDGALSVTSSDADSNITSVSIDSATGATLEVKGKLTTHSVSVHGGTTTFDGEVDGLETLSLDGGDAVFNADSQAGIVTVDGDSNLSGDGNLTVIQTLDWKSGSLGAGGGSGGAGGGSVTTNPFTTPPTTNPFTTVETTNPFVTVTTNPFTTPTDITNCPPEIVGCSDPKPSLTIAAGAQMVIDSGDQLTLAEQISVAGDAEWNAGDIKFADGGGIAIESGGTWAINDDLNFSGDGAITNRGILEKTSGTGNTTISGDLNVSDTGRVELNSGDLTLQGDTSFDNGASMYAGTDSNLILDGTDKTFKFDGEYQVLSTQVNDGTASWSAQATLDTLTLNGGEADFNGDESVNTIKQNDGTLGGDAGGKLSIATAWDWTSGDLGGAGATTIGDNATATVLGADAGTIAEGHSLENRGRLLLKDGGLDLGKDVTITNLGTLELAGDYNISNDDGGAKITNDSRATIKKSVGAGGGDNSTIDAAVEGDGKVDVTQGELDFGTDFSTDKGTVAMGSGAVVSLNDGTANIGGDATVQGGELDVAGATATFDGTLKDVDLNVSEGTALIKSQVTSDWSIGTLSVDGAATKVTLDSSISVDELDQSAGTIDGNGDLTLTGATSTWAGGTQAGYGTTTVSNGTTLSLEGSDPKMLNRKLDNLGETDWSAGDVALGLNGTLRNEPDATFDISGDGHLTGFIASAIQQYGTFSKSGGTGTTSITGMGTFDNHSDATLSVDSGTLSFSSPFDNEGDVTIGSGDKLKTAGIYSQNDGSTTLDQGSTLDPDGQPVQVHGGVLAGTGTVGAQINNTGGVVSPGGDGNGKLTVNGNYTQQGQGALRIDVAGNAPVTGYDQLDLGSGGHAFLDGTLNIVTADAFTPASGQEFTVILAGGGVASGRFGTVDGADSPNGASYDVRYNTHDVTLKVNPPQIDIPDIAAEEGDGGLTPVTLDLTLNTPSQTPITVNWATTDGTAETADQDYQADSGTVTFAPGDTQQSITVNLIGDTRIEPDENFSVELSNPTGATLRTLSAKVTIRNDDSGNGLKIVATAPPGCTGQFSTLGTGPSINDSGTVAFEGVLCATGSSLFVRSPAGTIRNINSGFGASSQRRFDDRVGISKDGIVVAQDRIAGSPPGTRVRIWDSNVGHDSQWVTLGLGGVTSSGTGSGVSFDATCDPYSALLAGGIGGYGVTIGACGENTSESHTVTATVTAPAVLNPTFDGSGNPLPGSRIILDRKAFFDLLKPFSINGLIDADTVQCTGQHLDTTGRFTILDDCHLLYNTSTQTYRPYDSSVTQTGVDVSRPSRLTAKLLAAVTIASNVSQGVQLQLDQQQFFDLLKPLVVTTASGTVGLSLPVTCVWQHTAPNGINTLLEGCTLASPIGSATLTAGAPVTQPATSTVGVSGGWDSVNIPGVNNNHDAVFDALSGNDWYIITESGQAGPYPGALRPFITNDGHVVARAGGDDIVGSSTPVAPITLWDDPTLSGSTLIACGNGCPYPGFTQLGRAPGASNTGQIVAFEGTMPSPPQALQQGGVSGGVGIYASVYANGGHFFNGSPRRLLQIAAVGDKADDGSTIARFSDPISDPTPSLQILGGDRVAVAGSPASPDHTATVLFDALDQFGNKGIYTEQIQFLRDAQGNYDPAAPTAFALTKAHRIVEVGSAITGLSGTVTDVEYWNPMNQRGQGDIALWVSMSDGTQAIVRSQVPGRRPVVFVPGVAGSQLTKNGSTMWLSPNDFTILGGNPSDLNPLDSPHDQVQAPDVLQYSINALGHGVEPVYHDFLQRIITDGGYTPYQLVRDGTNYYPGDSCDYDGQKEAEPNFFVFPYDWRLDNKVNAVRLNSYIEDCVQKFWPDTKVNILTHSMGGLLARKYEMDFLPNAQKHVNSMITVAGPWLGAPKLVYVMESGGFVTQLGVHVGLVSGPVIKRAVEMMAAPHQLMPSPWYFGLGGDPALGDHRTQPFQDYDFAQMKSVLNDQVLADIGTPPCPDCSLQPGTTAEDFHNAINNGLNQDDWRTDTSGIKYFHLYAQMGHMRTITQTFKITQPVCQQLNQAELETRYGASLGGQGIGAAIGAAAAAQVTEECDSTNMLEVHFGLGDGTVPTLSAARKGNHINLNAPNATLIPFFGHASDADINFDHNGMLNYAPIQDKVLELLNQEDTQAYRQANRVPYAARHMSSAKRSKPIQLKAAHKKTHKKTHKKAVKKAHKKAAHKPLKALKATRHLSDSPAPGVDDGTDIGASLYLTVVGGSNVQVTNPQGDSTGQDGLTQYTPDGVSLYPLGQDATSVVLTTDPGYAATFASDGGPLQIVARLGIGDNATQVQRYQAPHLPAGTAFSLTTGTNGLDSVQYDSNGDGQPDTALDATVLTGAAASDVKPPTLSLAGVQVGGLQRVGATATDDSSGVKKIWYSTNGSLYFPYTAPFGVDPATMPVVYAFAEDNAGNRSPVAQFITAGFPANHAPVVTALTVPAVERTPVTFKLPATDVDGDPLTYSIDLNPAHGTLGAIAPDGTVTFSPSAGFMGTDTFTFTASDVIAAPVQGTVTINVASDTAPVAEAASLGVRPGTPRILTLPASDADGTPLTFSIATQPQNGTLGPITGDHVLYTPAAGYTGPDSFTFKASDGVLDSNIATFSIDVIANRAPISVSTSIHAKPGLATTIQLGATDPDSDPLAYSVIRRPGHGTVTLNADGTATYTAAADYSGPDSFTWFASDGALDSAVATVSIDVHPDRAPVALDGSAAVKTGVPRLIVLNASDADADPLGFSIVAQPAHGTLGTVNGHVVQYVPAAGYTGSDSFTFKANDGTTDSNVATVTLTVADDLPPVPVNASVTVGSGNTKTIAFAATDPELDPLTYTIATQPQHGTLGPLIGNSVDYRPTDGFTGSDSFTFSVSDGSLSATGTISITVLPPVNNPPTPVNDTATTPEDTTATIAVLANDTDPNADDLRLVSVTQPLNGVAHVEPDGTVNYVPVPDFFGSDSFTYKVCDDGTTDGKAAPLCSTATTSVTITPVNDPPVAAADTLALAEDSTATVDVLANDVAGPNEASQDLTLASLGTALHGTVAIVNGVARYTPQPDYNGPDSFTYTACDNGQTNGAADPQCSTGTVSVTAWEVNDLPVLQPDSALVAEDGSVLVNALANDRPGPLNEFSQTTTVSTVGDPAHGTASIDPASGQIKYIPAPDYNGPDSFTYTVCDNGTTHGVAEPACATSTVSVAVSEVNDAPTATAIGATTPEDTSVTVNAVANDSPGPANEAAQHLTLTSVLQPQHGTAAIVNGMVQYTPAPDYNGPDSFQYTVCDDGTTNGRPDPLCATATINVVVTPVNDAPAPTQDSATLVEDSTLLVDVLTNDSPGPSDEASQTLTLQSVGTPARGTASIVHGKLFYVPSKDSNGPDSVTYTVCDDGTTNGQPDPKCSTGTLNLSVSEANDPPQAANDELSVPIGGSATVDVLANDVAGPANESSQTLSIQSLGTPAGGTAVVQAGKIVYTAATGFIGPDSFTYTVCDNGTTAGQSDPKCDNATVDIGVGVPAFNHTPQAHNGSFAMTEDAPPIQIDLGQLVSDRETASGNLTYTIVSQPVRGTVSVNGEIATYGTNLYARGTDTFTYKATDGGYPDGCGAVSATCQAPKTSVTRTVTITIAPVNHAPTVQVQAPAHAGEGAQIALVAAAQDVDGDPLTYTWTTTAGSLTTNGPNATLVVPDGPASAAVHVSVSDGNGGTAAADQTIAVDNVAPTGTFSNDGPVNDGQSFHLSLASITDPSAADTAAGFQIAFDCGAGAGYGPWGLQTTATCPTSDAGVRNVRSEVRDRDGGVTQYSGTVHVQSLAPDPTLTPSGTIAEGQSFTLTVRLGAGIPTAKYDYAFDCGDGSGYGGYGSALTVTCLTSDNAVRTVKVRVRGHDGTVTEATAGETVLNVAPIISSGSAHSAYWGLPTSFTGIASDPSSADTAAGLTPAWAWGDGTPSSLGLSATHAYAAPGTYTAVFSAVDKDGGRSQAASTVTVQKRTTSLAYTGPTNAAYGYAVLSAKLTDLIDAPSSLLTNESVAFIVGTTVYTAKADAEGIATVTVAAPVGVGTFAVIVQFAGDSRYAASIARATVKVVQSAGTVTGVSLAPASGGSASFTVSGNGTTSTGSLDYANGASTVHATSLTPLGIATDHKSAWFSGVSSTGQQVRVYVEDSGSGAADVFKLWINGALVTGTGALSGGDVQISPT